MTDHDTKINAMSDAHREISGALRRLAVSSSMLLDAGLTTHNGALCAACDILGSINKALYVKIHADHEE